MLDEAWLAGINTNNLMYERGLVKEEDLKEALYTPNDTSDDITELKTQYLLMEEKIKEIAKRLKEKK